MTRYSNNLKDIQVGHLMFSHTYGHGRVQKITPTSITIRWKNFLEVEYSSVVYSSGLVGNDLTTGYILHIPISPNATEDQLEAIKRLCGRSG